MAEKTYFEGGNQDNMLRITVESVLLEMDEFIEKHPGGKMVAIQELADKTGQSVRQIRYYWNREQEPGARPFLLIIEAIGRDPFMAKKEKEE